MKSYAWLVFFITALLVNAASVAADMFAANAAPRCDKIVLNSDHGPIQARACSVGGKYYLDLNTSQ